MVQVKKCYKDKWISKPTDKLHRYKLHFSENHKLVDFVQMDPSVLILLAMCYIPKQCLLPAFYLIGLWLFWNIPSFKIFFGKCPNKDKGKKKKTCKLI